MTGVSDALSSGLPDEVRKLLATPPVTEKKLLELGVAWPGMSPSQARMAAALRLFVITWDPLEWRAGRPGGFATANDGSPGLELVVYAPVWSLVELATERAVTMADVLGSMAGSAVVTAAAHEQSVTAGRYPDLGTRQAIPDLLSDLEAGSALGPVDVRLVSAGWEDIGLGAITDVVAHAFGPVDLDRSPVELAATAESHPGCPACAGRLFPFPAELAEAQDGMCPAHRHEAGRVISTRLARANASNPDGWAALIDASRRLEQPHLPNGVATKLAGAGEAMYVILEPGELLIRAELVVEAASWFPGRPDQLAIALGQEPELAGQLPDWLVNLVLDLGRAGLGAEAVMVGDALARVDPDSRACYDGDVMVALAEAGLAEEARTRIEASLTRWPDDFWIRVHAGDALAALGDLDGAQAHFYTALSMAEQADNFEARYDAIHRLRKIGRGESQDERGQPRGQRRQSRRKLSKSQRKRKRQAMASNPLRYEPYDASVGVPNVVVDGSPNASTVLTLSHWPQLPAPDGLADDLSAQMAFRYLDSGATLHGNAEVVTNNHFDQDGLISVYALSRPDDALARRTLLEDVAAAGDFATYRDRRAARLSMVIAAFADPERSPLAPLPDDHGGAATTLLYTELLGRLPELVDKLDTYRNLWRDEDRQLTSSEHILATGAAVIDEYGEVDLAVVTIDETVGTLSGHRFTGGWFDGIHPMALHNATDRFAVLLIRGRSYQFTYRYETWVQYRSRRPRPRVELTALAGQLTERETDGVTWSADPVGSLTPQLSPIGNDRESSIPAAEVVSCVIEHLTTAAPAWDPYP